MSPQLGSADAEIKVPSVVSIELKGPVVGQCIAIHATLTAGAFRPCLFLSFRSIHLHFFQNLSRFFPVLALANSGSCVSPQNEIGQPA